MAMWKEADYRIRCALESLNELAATPPFVYRMHRQGVEQRADSSENTTSSAGHAANSDASEAKTEPADADLQAVVTAWSSLPPAVKAGIVGMVKATNAM